MQFSQLNTKGYKVHTKNTFCLSVTFFPYFNFYTYR